MKKLFLLAAALLCCTSIATAQHSGWYVRGHIETPDLSDGAPFETLGVGAEAGKQFKNFELGLKLAYCGHPFVGDTEGVSVRMYNINARFGWDAIGQFRPGSRSHLKPYALLGWSEARIAVELDQSVLGDLASAKVVLKETGAQVGLGLRYDWDLNQSISLGAHYEYLFSHIEEDFLGVSVTLHL